MSVASQDVYLNLSTPLTVIGGGGSAISTFSTFNVSTLNVLNLTAGFIESANISSIFGEFDEIFCSSISTLGIILDDQILSAVGGELLLNGIPIATTANISTLADWAFDPAVSTLNMNGNSSINGSLLSTQVINAGSALITNLVCSTISSVQLETQAGVFSSINGIQIPQGIQNVSSFNTASVSSLTVSSINNLAYPPPNSDVSLWANFPAVSTITGGAGAGSDLNLRATRFLNANAVGVNVVVDEGANIVAPATFSVVAQNGNRGNISLTANPGFGGVFGQIGLTANGGTVLGVGTGGLIELTANTPLGTLSNATSAIKFSAAGINSYAGAIPSFGSLLGYNFIYGTLGVNLCAGSPPILPNTPGTTYLYGSAGITLGSQTNTGSDFTQSAGGLYTTLLTGYWAGGIFSPQNLVIRGRQIPVYGNSYVQISNVDILSFDSNASKAITGLSTINGVAYPPPAGSIPSNLTVSSLTAQNSVGTAALSVSSINGGSYPPPPGDIPPNLVVSTLTAAVEVSTPSLLVSSINGIEFLPPPSTLIVSSLIAFDSINTSTLSVSSMTASVAVISSLNVSSIVADTIKPRSVVIAGDITSVILLEQNVSAPIVSQPIIARASATGGSASTQTQYLRLTGTGESTAFLPQFVDTVTGSPSTIGHLGANILYLGSDTVNWASIKASGNASTIIMSGNLNVSSINTSTINTNIISSVSINVSSINGFPAFPALTNRASGTTSTIITASTFASAQTVGTVSLSTLCIADVDVFGIFTTVSLGPGQNELYYYATQNGVAIGTTSINTLQGNNHYMTSPVQATAFNLLPSTYTFGIKAYTPNGSGNLIVTPFQLCAIGHLI